MACDAGTRDNPFDQSGLLRGSDGLLHYADGPDTFVEGLELVARDRSDVVALIDADDRTFSYAELWEQSARVAGGLVAAGVRPGDRVAVDLPNSAELVLVMLGTLLAGAVTVPIDQRADEATRRAVLGDTDPAVVVDHSTALPSGRPTSVDVASGDLAQLLYTSGTTGEPKGVMADQNNLASLGEITRRVLALEMDDGPRVNYLVAMPLCHAAGCNAQLLPTLALGGTAVLTCSTSAPDVVAVARRHGSDTMLAVPAVYQLLVEREPAALQELTSLKRMIYGAAPVSESLIKALRELAPHVQLGNAFGMTEISNMALFLPDPLTLSHHDSVGFPVPGVEVTLHNVDDRGHGELFLRGPNMARGYWRKPELTAEAFGGGWVRSGDIAEVDEHGLVYVRDRTKDVINRGGEKIYTLQVENALLSHPAVAEAAVVPVPDEVMGEKVGAIVVPHEGMMVSGSALTDHVAMLLPRFAVPERLVTRDTVLPRGGSGKILKAQLRRELGWGG